MNFFPRVLVIVFEKALSQSILLESFFD